MYSLWWHKPLSPNEPIVLKGDWVGPMCAYMYTLSEVSGAVDQTSLKAQTAVKTLFAFLNLYSKKPEIENLAFKVPYGRDNELPPRTTISDNSDRRDNPSCPTTETVMQGSAEA